MATSGGLGDVHGEVAHALDVAGGVDAGHGDAQVGGYGRLQHEQGEGLLFGGGAEIVDAGVVGDDLFGQLQVGAQQRLGGLVECVGDQVAHVGQADGECVELVLIGVTHGHRISASGKPAEPRSGPRRLGAGTTGRARRPGCSPVVCSEFVLSGLLPRP